MRCSINGNNNFLERFHEVRTKAQATPLKFICKFTNVQSDRDTCLKCKNKNMRANSQSAPSTSDYCWYLDYHEIFLILHLWSVLLSDRGSWISVFFTIKSRKESYKITPFTDNYYIFYDNHYFFFFFFSIMQTGTLKLAETRLLLAL